MSYLLRTRTAFEECKTHIEEEKLSGTPIEFFLTQYLLVLLSSNVQEEITKISIGAITHSPECSYLEKYVTESIGRLFRSVAKSELAGMLGYFSEDVKNDFNSRLNEIDVSLYSNAISARHKVAHKSGSDISFIDLENGINGAVKIINAYEAALQNLHKKIIKEVQQ